MVVNSDSKNFDEEPEWDSSDEDDEEEDDSSSDDDDDASSSAASSSGDESNFMNERSVSDEEDSDDDDDTDDDGSVPTAKAEFAPDSDEDEDDDDSASDSSSGSDDSSYDSSVFENEDGKAKMMTNGGDLMNEPGMGGSGRFGSDRSAGPDVDGETGRNDSWMRCVPGCVLALGGVTAAAIFCACLIFIPLLALIVGLSVGLTTNNDNGGDGGAIAVPPGDGGDLSASGTTDINDLLTGTGFPMITVSPTMSPTTAAQSSDVTKLVEIDSSSDTTIYRNGLPATESHGDESTMLVQNGPPGDPALASAYSLVRFDDVSGIDPTTMLLVGSDDTAATTDGNNGPSSPVTVQFCLTRAPNEEEESSAAAAKVRTYSTCLLFETPETTGADIERWTGDTAPEYTIPLSCVNGEYVNFDVVDDESTICIDVTSLFTEEDKLQPLDPEQDKPDPSRRRRRNLLRGGKDGDDRMNSSRHRSLEESGVPPSKAATAADLLFIIDALEVSDQPGDRFYTSSATASDSAAAAGGDGPQPTFQIVQEKEEKEEPIVPEIEETPKEESPNQSCESTVDVICKDPELSTLCGLMVSTGFVASGTLTLAAPINEALDVFYDPTNSTIGDEILQQVLLYHVVPNETITSTDIVCGKELVTGTGAIATTVCGAYEMVYLADSGYDRPMPWLASIWQADIETCEGVIHKIDEVLIPPPLYGADVECSSSNATQSIVDIVCTDPQFSLLCGLVSQAGMSKLLSTGTHTVFAPTDEAISAAMESVGTTVDLTDPEVITDILLLHIMWGYTMDSEELKSFCGDSVFVANYAPVFVKCQDEGKNIFVGGTGNDADSYPNIVTSDLAACNGIIHVIDGVIFDFFDENSSIMPSDLIADLLGSFPDDMDVASMIETLPDGTEISDLVMMIPPEMLPDGMDHSDVIDMIPPGMELSDLIGMIPPTDGTIPDDMDLSDLDNIFDDPGMIPDMDGGGGAAIQLCNICGSGYVTKRQARIKVPKTANFPGLEEHLNDKNKATCGFLDDSCNAGFCDQELCDALSTQNTKDTCHCVTESISPSPEPT